MTKLFEKQPNEITKYDWVIACGFDATLSDSPRVLRLANVLMQLADKKTCIAFPTQTTICQLARMSTDRQAREALSKLSACKAITAIRISQLTAQELDENPEIKNRDKRGQVYKLNLFWAYETIESYKFRLKNPDTDANIKISSRLRKRPVPDRYERPEPDRYIAACNRPANTGWDTSLTLTGALDEEGHYGSVDYIRAREGEDRTTEDTTQKTSCLSGTDRNPTNHVVSVELPSNGYIAAHDDSEIPFNIPSSEIEADELISGITEGESLTNMQRSTLKALLTKGHLSPASTRRMLENFREARNRRKADEAA